MSECIWWYHSPRRDSHRLRCKQRSVSKAHLRPVAVQCSSHGYTWIFTIVSCGGWPSFLLPHRRKYNMLSLFGACPEAAAVPEALCSSQAQVPAWACSTSLKKRRLNSVNPYGFPFLPFLVMPTHVRIDSHSYSVGVWGREGKAICLLILVTKNTHLWYTEGGVLPSPQSVAVVSSAAK